MNREKCEKLIEKLADKKYSEADLHDGDCMSCGINNVGFDHECRDIVLRPIRIGDVLEKMRKIDGSNVTKLLFAWEPCVFTKSLQEIIEESGWEKKIISQCRCMDPNHHKTVYADGETLKDPNARALFDYLITLFL